MAKKSTSDSQSSAQLENQNMRVALGSYKPLTDKTLRLVKQLGVNDILLTPHRHDGFESAMPLGEEWSYDALLQLRNQVNEAGVRLFAFEKMPIPLYEILLTEGEEREEKIQIIKDTIRNMGRAGIPVLGYSGHPPDGAVRTTREKPIRGGALTSAFDVDDLDDPSLLQYGQKFEEEEIWEAYEYFLKEVIPVAEEADVNLALHPSDPPVEELFGIPLLFRNFTNFKRALNLVPSDNHGLKLCLGCWSEMGEDLEEVIRYFGGEKILYVHFRDVVGTVPAFYETFIDDEESNFDEYQIMKTLNEVGFRGVMTPDHVPLLEGESEWEFGSALGRSYTTGYLKGLLRSIESEK